VTDAGFDAVVIGNVGVDTNVYPLGEFDWNREGHFTENLDCVGQAGGYASRGYARLGKRVALIGHVGHDANGRWIRETLAADGIDASALFVDPAGTARSVNFMLADGGRRNFYDGKGHMTLEPDLDRCRAVLAGAKLAHFNIPNWARKLLPEARRAGAAIATDLQDLRALDDPYRRDFIEQSDFLFFSAAHWSDPREPLEALLRMGPARVVIAGMGDRGCAMATRDRIEFFDPIPWHLPVVDTNGAGDSLAVGFLASHVLDGDNPADAARRGQICARHACTLRADSGNLLDAGALDAHFLAGR